MMYEEARCSRALPQGVQQPGSNKLQVASIVKWAVMWGMIVSFTGCSSSFEVNGRYLNYDCSPVVGEDVVMRGTSHAFLGYSYSGASDRTDSNGNFSGSVSGSAGLTILPQHELATNWGGGKETRHFWESELRQLRSEMSPKNPVIIYKEPELPRRDMYHRWLQQRFGLISPSRGEKPVSLWYEFPGSISSREDRRSHLKVEFERLQKGQEPSWQVTFSGVNGGLIEVAPQELPFSEQLPEKGYNQQVVFEFSKGYVGRQAIKKAFYLKADGGRAYATVIVNLMLVPQEVAVANRLIGEAADSPYFLTGNMFVDIIFVEKFASQRPPIVQPYLQQRKCSGVMAYDYRSYYATAPELPAKPDAVMMARGDRLREKDAAYDLIEQAKRPETSVEWLLEPEHMHNRWVALGMLKRRHLDDRVAQAMLDYYAAGAGAKEGYQVLEAMSAASCFSPDFYDRLASSSSAHIYTLAINRNLPQNVLQKIIRSHMSKEKEVIVLRSVAQNPALSKESVEMLADSVDPRVLYLAADHANASPELLEKLSQHPDLQVKGAVAWNLHTPSHVLKNLSALNIESINNNIAANPNAPSAVLVKLSKSENKNLLYVIGCNPNTPDALRRSLFESSYKPFGACWKKKRENHWRR